MLSRRLAHVLIGFGLLYNLDLSNVRAYRGQAEPYDPVTCQSKSGRYVLHINPSRRDGVGPASYRMTSGGKEAWRASLPFTFAQVVVTDSGLVAGIAYTETENGLGDMKTVFLDAKGGVKREESEPRQHSPFFDAEPNPIASGLILQEPQDRLTVRVADPDLNRASEEWRIYRLSDAQRVATIRPKEYLAHIRNLGRIMQVRSIPAMPLMLVQWSVFDQALGSVFTVIDAAGRPAWELVLRNDYRKGSDKAEDEWIEAIWDGEAVFDRSEARQFEIWQVADGKRVTYEVIPAPAEDPAWDVRVVREQAYTRPAPPVSQPSKPELPKVDLKLLGTTELRTDTESKSPIRRVRQFTFDHAGRLVFVREDEDKWTLVSVEPATGKTREAVLKGVGGQVGASPIVACTAPDRYVVLLAGYTAAKAWWCDSTGARNGIELPDWLEAESVAPRPEGGFVIMGGKRSQYTDEPVVLAFDQNGEELWSIGHDYSDPSKLFGPKDLTTTVTGTVAVLDNSGKRIQIYDKDGGHVENLDLRPIMGDSAYPTDISPDGAGGWWVYDFGNDTCFQLSGTGQSRSIKPAYSDGRKFRPADLQVAADRALWTSDTESILRLDEKGRVAQVLGNAPNPDRLDDISAFTIDEEGRMYAVAGRTGSVHVFDERGHRLKILRTGPMDFASDRPPNYVSVAGDGSVLVGSSYDGRHIQFSSDGRRIAPREWPSVRDWSQVHFSPANRPPWITEWESIAVTNEAGEVVQRIERAPDDTWLRCIRALAFNRKGLAAVLCGDILAARATYVATYDAVGRPVRMFNLPVEAGFEIAANDTRAFIPTASNSILIARLDGKEFVEFSPPILANPRSYWHPFVSPDQRELWVFVADSRTLYRYGLP